MDNHSCAGVTHPIRINSAIPSQNCTIHKLGHQTRYVRSEPVLWSKLCIKILFCVCVSLAFGPRGGTQNYWSHLTNSLEVNRAPNLVIQSRRVDQQLSVTFTSTKATYTLDNFVLRPIKRLLSATFVCVPQRGFRPHCHSLKHTEERRLLRKRDTSAVASSWKTKTRASVLLHIPEFCRCIKSIHWRRES